MRLFAPFVSGRSKRFNMSCTHAELLAISRMAKARGLTASDFVRELLRGAMDVSNVDESVTQQTQRGL